MSFLLPLVIGRKIVKMYIDTIFCIVAFLIAVETFDLDLFFLWDLNSIDFSGRRFFFLLLGLF